MTYPSSSNILFIELKLGAKVQQIKTFQKCPEKAVLCQKFEDVTTL